MKNVREVWLFLLALGGTEMNKCNIDLALRGSADAKICNQIQC